MVSFSIPTGKTADTFFNFTVENRCLLFAGSRNFELNPSLCSHLINSFGKLGFSFLTGCASGVDKSFRYALSTSSYSKNSIVACAFKYRLKDPSGLCSLLVVPDNLNPKVALAKRTLWMTSRCSLLVLFPDFPCGSGSRLAFKSAIMNNKPICNIIFYYRNANVV